MYEYEVDPASLRAVDGDTVDCVVDLGFRVYLGQRLRLAGINAAEHDTEAGQQAKEYLAHHLSNAVTARIVTTQGREKYGRLLAHLWVRYEANGPEHDLNADLVRTGHAVPWDGRGSRPVPKAAA